jgi:hypothetical protein
MIYMIISQGRYSEQGITGANMCRLDSDGMQQERAMREQVDLLFGVMYEFVEIRGRDRDGTPWVGASERRKRGKAPSLQRKVWVGKEEMRRDDL